MKLYYEQETQSFLKKLFLAMKGKKVQKFNASITSVTIEGYEEPIIFKNGPSDIAEEIIETAELKNN